MSSAVSPIIEGAEEGIVTGRRRAPTAGRRTVAMTTHENQRAHNRDDSHDRGRRAKGTDARAEVTLSADGMQAMVTLRPAGKRGRQLSERYLDHVLEGAGVTYGVDRHALVEAMQACNAGRAVENCVIARGKSPTPDKPQQLVLRPRPAEGSGGSGGSGESGKSGEAGNQNSAESEPLDYRSRSPYVVVKRGEELAFTRSFEPGRDGQSVRGELVLRGTQAAPQLQAGRNTVSEGGRVFAACSGRFVTDGTQFWVEDTLEIAGDVDYTTGHINFPGNVVITGLVKDRFRVWAGGDLECHGTLDAFEVFCKGMLKARGGIIGRGQGLVRVVGDIAAKFIENSVVESKSSVSIAGGILKSRVYCLGELRTGKRGRIIGSEVRAGGSILCNQLGNDAQTPTTVVAGVNFIAERKLQKLRERREELLEELSQLDRRIALSPTPRRERRRAELARVLELLAAQVGELSEQAVANGEAQIAVEGRVYPGVTVVIGTACYVVGEPLKRVRFAVDAGTGGVTYENLS